MNFFNSVVSRSHTPDLTESYFGKLASGHFPRLKSGQIRQIGNNIFQFTADNLLGSSNIGLDVGSQGQHEYTEACFFVIANSGEVPGTGIQIFERENDIPAEGCQSCLSVRFSEVQHRKGRWKCTSAGWQNQ